MRDLSQQDREMIREARDRATEKGIEVGGVEDLVWTGDGLMVWFEKPDERGIWCESHLEIVKSPTIS